MFELSQAITEWRRQMLTAGIKTPGPLDELESHLRDDLEQQIQSGVSAPQAFETAIRRIGQVDVLKAEFKKAANPGEARPGTVIGIACCAVAGLFSLWMTPGLLTIHELSMAERIWGLAAVTLTMLSIVSWQFSHRYLPVIRHQRLRMAVGVACSLTGVGWLFIFCGKLLPNIIVPHILGAAPGDALGFVFKLGILVLWAMAFTAGLGSIAYGLEKAAHRQAVLVDG